MPTKLTAAEKAALPHNLRILAEINEAEARGDDAAVCELHKQMNYSAESLLSLKLNLGADWLRAQGWNLDAAEAKYGKDWLDREVIPGFG